MSRGHSWRSARRRGSAVRWLAVCLGTSAAFAAFAAFAACARAHAQDVPPQAPLSEAPSQNVIDAQAQAPAQAPETPGSVQTQQEPAQASAAVPLQLQPSRTVRNVVVPLFHAPETSRARASVLQTLADHPEVEVLSIDDVTFAAMRLQADAYTPQGRAKLSRELGIDAWLDGQVQDESLYMTLSTGDGGVIQAATVEANSPSELDSVAGDRMWAALGTRLSPEEGRRKALLSAYEIARLKQEARSVALEQQKALGRERRERKQALLRAQSGLAQRKRAALLGEVARQTLLAKTRQPPPPAQPEVAAQAQASTKTKGVHRKHKAKRKHKARAARARHKRRGVATTGLTNTGDIRAKRNAHAKRRKARAGGSAADSGKSKEPEFLSRQ